MKRIMMGMVILLMLAAPVFAAFCSQCGSKIEEGSKFCSGCGTKLGEIKKKPTTPDKPPVHKFTGKEYRTKTEVYIYEKRGDEKNVLKKNFLFKPRRWKLPHNARFEVLEELDGSCLIQSIPSAGEKVFKGWVLQKELLLRTDWEKK